MNYNPDDQRVTFREVAAGWILCLAMVGLGFASAGHHPVMPSMDAGDAPPAVATSCCPLAGARLPSFTPCAAEPRDTVRIARGPLSLPATPCS